MQNVNAFLSETTMLDSQVNAFFSDDDIWEYIDLDADSQIGEVVEYKTSVLFHDVWVDSKWNKG